MSFFTSSAESFNPRPYLPHASHSVNHTKPPTASTSRAASTVATKPFDPSPDDPNVIILHPPFDDFPYRDAYPDGLTYNVLAENQEWFLDPSDFRTDPDSDSEKIPYPPILEPPRGWCPVKKGQEVLAEEDAPKLRCTFCRRKYAGVNAKSMWRRHVLEKHKIPMANRRDGPHDNARGVRISNSKCRHNLSIDSELIVASEENKGVSKGNKSGHKSSSEEPQTNHKPARDCLGASSKSNGAQPSLLPAYGSPEKKLKRSRSPDEGEQSYLADTDELPGSRSPTPSPKPSSSALPSSSSSQELVIPPESPYDPSKTPAFKHTSNRPRRQQPWRFPSPSHPLYNSPDELCLGVPIAGMAGEGLRSAYVPAQASPLPIGNLKRRSPVKSALDLTASPLNSSPLCSKIVNGKILGWKRSASDSRLRPALPTLTPIEVGPRRLFSYRGPLPVPVTERLEYIQGDVSMDELSTGDSSFTSELGDPFNALLNPSTVAEVDDDGSPIDLAAKVNFSDSPIIHASEIDDDILGTCLDTESWCRQRSGIGLGIFKSGVEPEEAVVNDLFHKFTQDGSGGDWESDVIGGLTSSQDEVEEEESDRTPTDDESPINSYITPDLIAPPLKRRRTIV